jgi:CubicO group peptidase (beta-lactamase class C family)
MAMVSVQRRSILTVLLLGTLLWGEQLRAVDLPRLPKGLDPKKQNFLEQKKLPDLHEPYLSASPEDIGDGLKVGNLDAPGAKEAIQALVKNDQAGKFANLDSLLLWKDGKLIFEMYNRRGRVDGPHYAMSVTKTMTSVTLARAIQLGLLSMKDLDKPVIDFLPAIDRSKIKPGVATITLRDALFMKSGLRFPDKNFSRSLGSKYPRQKHFQKLFESTSPITPASKEYKYTGTDPSLIMMIIDLKAKGTAEEFFAREVAEKVGAIYCWDNQGCGIPKCGAGSNFTSRSLLKIGTAIAQGGKYNGEQLLSAEYLKAVMDTNKGEGYFYYFHNRKKPASSNKVNFISGIGAGGQYMSIFPRLNLVMVATSHNKGKIGAPLEAVLDHLIPLFGK